MKEKVTIESPYLARPAAAILSTDRSESSYGQPVLVIDHKAFDLFDAHRYGWRIVGDGPLARRWNDRTRQMEELET